MKCALEMKEAKVEGFLQKRIKSHEINFNVLQFLARLPFAAKERHQPTHETIELFIRRKGH